MNPFRPVQNKTFSAVDFAVVKMPYRISTVDVPCLTILGGASNKNKFKTMPANQPNPVRGGGFTPGGNRNGTSLKFVRMASALTWCDYA